VAQAVEWLLCNLKPFSSNPMQQKKKKKQTPVLPKKKKDTK
jgi:hypothetical protein